MIRVLVLTLVTVVLGATGALAQSADAVARAVAGLRSDSVYVDAEASSALSASEAEALRARIRDADIGPVYLAVLPESALDAAGGDPDTLIREIGEGVARPGTYGVVAGRSFRAGATPDTPFAAGTVPAVANEAAQNANGDVATLLTGFVGGLDQAAATGGRVDGGSAGGGGVSLLPILLIGGLGFFALRTVGRRRKERQHLEEVRRVAEEDLTTLGNDIYDLESAFTMPGANGQARGYYDAAVNDYQRARHAMDTARRPDDLAAATEAMESGRFAVACVRAALAGQPLPQHRAPCFFAPSHGPSTRDVEWAPPGGDPRPVPACEADAQRVERGEEPDTRLVTVDGQRRPYWDTPSYYGGWAGGYYGGFGGMGFLQGMMWGSMLGGGWGFGGFGHGGHADAGGFGGGDFGGGGGFGGGDFGGGFGGGDFGGGDF